MTNKNESKPWCRQPLQEMNMGLHLEAVEAMPHTALQPSVSLVDYCAEKLEALCRAAGFRDQTREVIDIFRSLVLGWTNVPRDHRTKWISEIADDNTPIEFSVAITDSQAEVRVLFETQAEEPTLAAYREAGLKFQERLEKEFRVDLSRFRRVQDLLLPEGMQGPFAIWNSVVFSTSRVPQFKAYLNPQAHGKSLAADTVEECLRRLGLPKAWDTFRETVARRGPHLDELKYFALDLSAEPQARIKLYVRHHGISVHDMAMTSASTQDVRESHAFIEAMRGGTEPLYERAPFTCSAFVEGSDGHPWSTTLYVPVCAYAKNDAIVCTRIHDYLVSRGLDPTLYHRLVNSFASRPLSDGVGMQSWTALRNHNDQLRLTVYLASEARHIQTNS